MLIGEIGDELEGVRAGLPGRLERHADEGRLGIRVGRARERAVVGRYVFAEGHPHGEATLVVRLVRVQLRPGGVAGDPQAVRHPKPAVARERRRPTRRVQAVMLQPEVVERHLPADGHEDRVALDGRSVVELDHVRAVAPRPGPRLARPGCRSARSRRPPRASGG